MPIALKNWHKNNTNHYLGKLQVGIFIKSVFIFIGVGTIISNLTFTSGQSLSSLIFAKSQTGFEPTP